MEHLELMKKVAKAIAVQFGDSCEVVVHDLTGEDPDHTIAYIENGNVSKREVGGAPSQIALETLNRRGEGLPEDELGYLTRTQGGRILKSSTVFIPGEDGKVEGILSINFDVTEMLTAEHAINSIVNTTVKKEPEQIPMNVSELLDELIDRSVATVGKPVAAMTKDDKIKAIDYLYRNGAFLVTKSGDKIAEYFGISKYTLYSYIDAAKNAHE